VELLETGGYEAFTIAAVCDRAQVAPRAYTNGPTARTPCSWPSTNTAWPGCAPTRPPWPAPGAGTAADQLADRVVRRVGAIFFRHAAFLRPVMLVSAAHPEIRRRGSSYGRELGDLVTAALMHARDDIDHPDPETVVRGAFNTMFATLVMRIAYGPAFVTPADDEAFLANLSTMTRRYLFRL
jgi:hypothetical protein